ncbi:MAG: SDR family NAD(P)-dependent oxidoreductase [Clostridiales Family XIII bacterium]|jgi:sorbitol-6-phosphate 2-dehydrogenase|nr:SDR family NAD(P)-dependent oxidoreductase [Clostridiales Family XIII bacterium]
MSEDHVHNNANEDFAKLITILPAVRELYIRHVGDAFVIQTDNTYRNSSAGDEETLDIEPDEDIEAAFTSHVERRNQPPARVSIRGIGTFSLSVGPRAGETRSMNGKSVVITGGAQGFGEGLARGFAARGAYVTVADINKDGAEAVAKSISQSDSVDAQGVYVDVSDEASVRGMIESAVRRYGGVDVMIACAGILVAGGVENITRADFDRVTAINYTGYFLCAKYAAMVMKQQSKYAENRMFDIIEINSKSGLEGSKANFVYAGSKFGGIGLTQSFALELAEYGIKVNAICPGNLLDGPLWSDPERGLFRQYLDAGKVPGAKNVGDVRRFYEAKVPLGRGCTVDDVMTAAAYLVVQQYETGQALPVTGGQVMLK